MWYLSTGTCTVRSILMKLLFKKLYVYGKLFRVPFLGVRCLPQYHIFLGDPTR
jgi:hypothetical protein